MKRFTLIELMIVIAIIAIIAAIAIPNLLSSRKHGNEAAAIQSLKTLISAQRLYRERDKDGDLEPDYGSLTELGDQGLVDDVLARGTKQGYTFVTFAGATAQAPADHTFYATGNPYVMNSTGDRGFVTNHMGLIFYTTSMVATINGTTLDIPPGHNPIN